MTATSLKLRFAGAAFAMVVCAIAAVAAIFLWQHDVGTRRLGAVAENTARDRVAKELRARVDAIATHAADTLVQPVRKRDTEAITRNLQPFAQDPTVSAITVTDPAGFVIYRWRRPEANTQALQVQASEAIRGPVETIPGAAMPQTFGRVEVTVQQVAGNDAGNLAGRLSAAGAEQSRTAMLLAAGLALAGGLVGAALAWRTGRRVERPIAALIRGAERIGQGDYTRPLEVRRRDELVDLQQALEMMRGRLRQSTVNKSYLHSVLNSMTDAVFITSPDGVVKMANSAACKMLAYAEEELLGKSILAVLEERERADFDLLQAAQETRETVVRTRSGQTIPVSFAGSRID